MATGHLFDKSPHSDLYVYSGTGTPIPGATYRVAFLQDPDKRTLLPSYTITESWADPKGLYLFYNGTPADESMFVQQVRHYVASSNLAGCRMLWITDPTARTTEWVSHALVVEGAGPGATLAELAQLTFSNYTLNLARGVTVTADDPGAGATTAGFTLTRSTAGQFSFSPNAGVPALDGVGATLGIPLEGEAIGAFTFELAVGESGTRNKAWATLDAGMKFFYEDDTWQPGYLAALHYPLIDPGTEPVVLHPCLDPINPLSATRSYLGLQPASGAPPTLSTYYRTWVGRKARLVPQAGGRPSLVFTPRPQYLGDPEPPFYLTPAGSFTLDIPPLGGRTPGAPSTTESDSVTRLMCGVSPVEYVGSVRPASGSVRNVLTFHPGNKAFAPAFTPKGSRKGVDAALQDKATTSYVTLKPDGPPAINYYSQPSSSVFYDASPHAPPADADFLDLKEIITKPLGHSAADAMPMVPLAGLTRKSDPLVEARFEQLVLSPTRRGIVQGSGGQQATRRSVALAAPSAVDSRATTRHGMLGFFGTPTASSVPFVKVQLAQSRQGTRPLTLAGAGRGDIAGRLKEALQSNQLFLVLSNATKFAQHGSFLSSLLEIAGIPFDLSPDHWADKGTIIVYKYAPDSLEHLAGDLGTWTFPELFTDGGVTQNDLEDILTGIKKKIDGPHPDTSFQHVYDAVTQPAWNGILAFNTDVSLASMPGQLAGIAAGIDPAAFKAHHLGINISPMQVVSGQLTMKDTALFGLIDYEDQRTIEPGQADYRFRVSMLKILFGNSEIKDFACKIDLQVNSLFGGAVELLPDAHSQHAEPGASPNLVELNGYYQRNEKGNTFSFSTQRDLHFKAASQVLAEVEFFTADFVTKNPNAPANAQGVKHLETHFSFTGSIRFHEVPDFDALSFGDTSGTPSVKGGLAFSRLTIHMDYDLDRDGVSSHQQFTFDAQNLTVDPTSSKARPESLYSHFPLELKRFVQGKSGTTPTGLGYLGVSTPASESGLRYPWFALEYEINLGTLGALASSAGFTAPLLIAWSPAPGVSQFVGMKIPGASPQSLSFSVEGLLGLSIDDIRFLADRSPEGHQAYTLVFSNLALRFFGLKLPQSAYVDLVLFGNPDPSKKAASLGWYAAYVDAEAKG